MSMTDERTDSFFEMCADLRLSLGKMNAHLERQNKMMAKQLETPAFIRIHSVLTIPASGAAIMNLLDNTGPSQGWVWYLRKLVVAGVTPNTSVAGVADLFVSACNTPGATPSTLDWVDHAGVLPLFGVYSRGECTLRFNEEFQIVFTGATAGQQYVAAGLIEQFQEGIREQGFEM
jgi:hypothetical protein